MASRLPSTKALMLATRDAEFGDVATTGVAIFGDKDATIFGDAVKTSTFGDATAAKSILGVPGLIGGRSETFGLVN